MIPSDSGTPQIADCSSNERIDVEREDFLVEQHRGDDRRQGEQVTGEHAAGCAEFGETGPHDDGRDRESQES